MSTTVNPFASLGAAPVEVLIVSLIGVVLVVLLSWVATR